MSYDIKIIKRHKIHDYNYTSNIYEMFAAATKRIGADPEFKSLKHFDDMSCSFAASILKDIIIEMRSDPEYYQTFNPDNGWGVYSTFLQFLEKLYQDCMDHPDCDIEVNW